MENTILITTHLVLFFGAMAVCRIRPQLAKDNLIAGAGFFCLPIFVILVLVLLDFSNHAGNGTYGAWYLIFSMLTLGALPILSHASAAISGICAFRCLGRWIAK